MTERARDWFQQWLSPGIVINVIGFLLLLGGGWVRLNSVERHVDAMQDQMGRLQAAGQDSAKSVEVELVRYQERTATLDARVRALESFKDSQEQANVRFFSSISTLTALSKPER